MHILNLVSIENISALRHPETPQELTLSSPATAIFTDFRSQTPIVIDSATPAVLVEERMLRAHVKLSIVLDANEEFLGVITLKDLSSDRIIRLVAEGTERAELRVSDLMTHKKHLRALPVEDVLGSTVGDVLLTLQHAGIQHCLVVDRDENNICGLISASDVARRLRLPVSVSKAPYFSEIYAAVSQWHENHRRSGT